MPVCVGVERCHIWPAAHDLSSTAVCMTYMKLQGCPQHFERSAMSRRPGPPTWQASQVATILPCCQFCQLRQTALQQSSFRQRVYKAVTQISIRIDAACTTQSHMHCILRCTCPLWTTVLSVTTLALPVKTLALHSPLTVPYMKGPSTSSL